MSAVVFHVIGEVASQGSKTAITRGGKTWMIEGGSDLARARLKAWRSLVTMAARAAASKAQGVPFDGPVEVDIEFRFTRPKTVKPTIYKATKPDLDKCVRSTFDAMSGVIFTDDARVAEVRARKVFVAHNPGARIRVGPIGEIPA